ncbi:uncharacterized protein TNCV_4622811 [Trichonephila clavipes]|nr:uncharacterized protein TNCV_4622811 [Trichonephila clavipes]
MGMSWRTSDCTGNDFLRDAGKTENFSNVCIAVSEKPVCLSVRYTIQGVPGVRRNLKACVARIRGATRDEHADCICPRKYEPHDGLESVGSRRPSTLSCAACAPLESYQPLATCRFFTMVPQKNWLCNQTLPHTCYLPMTAVSVGKNFSMRTMYTIGPTLTHIMRLHSYQRGFSVNVWAGIIHDHLIGPHLLPRRMGGGTYLVFLQEMLPVLLQSVPSNIKARMWFQHDGAPAHFIADVRSALDTACPRRWIGSCGLPRRLRRCPGCEDWSRSRRCPRYLLMFDSSSAGGVRPASFLLGALFSSFCDSA